MSIFLLNIGDEVLDGRTLNTNAAYFGEKLRNAGIPIAEVRCVSDRIQDITKALKDAAKFPLVIVTGGLGPTNDDRTVEAAAKAFRRTIVASKESLAFVRSRYEKRGLEFTPERQRLANFPKGAKLIENPTGTAPGLHLKQGKTEFFFLPGVPSECKPMFEAAVLPRAQKILTTKKLERREFWRCFGKGESHIYQRIAPTIKALEKKYPDTFVFGVHISFPCIDLTFETWKQKGKKSPSPKEIEEALTTITNLTKDVCFTRQRESLTEVVFRLLKEKNATLATAESCTGGLIGKMLTDLPGSSAIYLGGAVSYANDAKMQLLSVREQTLQKVGAVSDETVKEMAAGIRARLNSTYAVSISGVSGPSGGTPDKPIGTTWVAISGPKGTKSLHQHILNGTGSREQNRTIAAYLALNAVREEILGADSQSKF